MLPLLAALIAGGCGPSGRTVVRLIDGRAQETRFVSPSAYLHYLRSRIALSRGLVAEAEQELEQALIFDPGSPHLLTQLAAIKARTGHLGLALGLLDRALNEQPGFPEALRLKARVLWRLKRPGEAETTLRRCVSKNPGFPLCYLTHVALLERTGRLAEARTLLEELIKRAPENREGRRRLGRACLALIDYPCAARELDRALALGWDLETALTLSRVQRAGGRFKAAEKILRAAFGRAASDLSVARELTQLLDMAGRKEAAEDNLSLLEQEVEEHPNRLSRVVLLFLELKRPQRALSLLEARRTPEQGVEMELLLARAMGQSGREAEADRIFARHAAGIHGAQAGLAQAELLVQRGRLAAAEATLSRSLKASPGDEDLLVALTHLHYLMGRSNEGAKLLLRSRPAGASGRSRSLGFALAQALERSGQRGAALAEGRKLLKETPRDAAACNLVGYLLVLAGQDLDAAEKLLQRASQLEPARGYILDSLGWLHRSKGDLDQARQILVMANRLSPQDAMILGHLAEVNADLGRSSRAIELLKQAMSAEPESPLTRKLRARLQQLERGRVVTK